MGIYYTTNEYTIRQLKIDDFSKGYKDLLENLTVTYNLDDEIFREVFIYQEGLNNQYFNIVIEDHDSGLLIGTGALLVKYSFIVNCQS